MTAILFAIIFTIVTIAGRLVEHAPNFAPVGALALWSGFYLTKRWGALLPLAVMFATDAMIGFYDPRLMAVVYGSFAAIVVLGWVLRSSYRNLNISKYRAGSILFGSLAGSLLFYVVTNFAVWAFSAWYPHTFAGLLESYTLAIPFFRNTLLGDLFYNGVFFGAYALAAAAARNWYTLLRLVRSSAG